MGRREGEVRARARGARGCLAAPRAVSRSRRAGLGPLRPRRGRGAHGGRARRGSAAARVRVSRGRSAALSGGGQRGHAGRSGHGRHVADALDLAGSPAAGDVVRRPAGSAGLCRARGDRDGPSLRRVRTRPRDHRPARVRDLAHGAAARHGIRDSPASATDRRSGGRAPSVQPASGGGRRPPAVHRSDRRRRAALEHPRDPRVRGGRTPRLPVAGAVVPALLLLTARHLAAYDPPRVLGWRLLHDDVLASRAAGWGPLLPRPSGALDRDPIALALAALAAGLAILYLVAALAGARPRARMALLAGAAVLLGAVPPAPFVALGGGTGPAPRAGGRRV